VAEELLDLAQVRARSEEFGGEDVPERVRCHALALVDTSGVDVVAEDLPELRVVESVALDADEDRLLGEWDSRGVVLSEERCERGMDRDRPLPSALRLPNPEQPAREVDVVPVKPDQLAAAQSALRHQREQQPVALRLAREVPLPEVVANWLREQSLELAHRQRVREHLSLLRRPQRQRRVAQDALLLDEEAEEALERRRRPRLARDSRAALLLLGEEGAQVHNPNLGEVLEPLTMQVSQTRRNVTLVSRARHRGKAPFRAAKAQEIG
jgi:hypothetical protein